MRLVIVAAEIGGRMSDDSRDLLRQLASARARSAPLLVRAAAKNAWLRRWTGMLGVAVQDALAATLVDDAVALLDGCDGEAPPDVDAWVDDGGGVYG